MLPAVIMLLTCLPTDPQPTDVPPPAHGGDHAWMAWAGFCALTPEERAWLYPEIPAFMDTWTKLPDMNWNNYGTFGGWSGLPDQPRTPDLRRELEICEFTGWNPNTRVGQRFGHEPGGLQSAIPWYLPRIVERLRGGQFMGGIIQLGALCHLIQDCTTFPHMQALHRSASFDPSQIDITGYQPRMLAGDVEGLVAATLQATDEMVAATEARAPELRAAQQAGDAAAEGRIRVQCCAEASKVCADLIHTIIALVGECPRPGPPEIGANLAANPGAEEEDPGERLPRHWVVGYGDLTDRIGRAQWEGQIQRNAVLWHGGRRSLNLMWTPQAGLEWRQTWPASVYVREGEHYAASAWVKTYAATGDTQVVLGFYRDDLSPVAEAACPPVQGTEDWRRLAVASAVPEGACRARVILRSSGNEGAAWFDDVELVRVDAATAEDINASGPEAETLVLHLPLDSDVQDRSAYRGVNAPIGAFSGNQAAELLADDPARGRVLALDGADDFVEVPHSHVEDVLSPGAMTVSLWLRADRPGPALICGKFSDAGGKPRGWRLELGEDATVRFSVATGGSWEPAATAPLPIGRWAHIAAVRGEDGAMLVCVDGQPGAAVSGPGDYPGSNASLCIGADRGVSRFMAGRVDDLRIWRRALTAGEITELAAAPKPTP